MRKPVVAIMVMALLTVPSAWNLLAHCQVPCGIYDDAMRVSMIREHIATIEKAMVSVVKLSAESPLNHNQIVRWIMNKEKHAESLSDIVTYYFMAQRLKPVPAGDNSTRRAYRDQLETLHRMLVVAMKAKQTTDIDHVKELRRLTDRFEEDYFAQ